MKVIVMGAGVIGITTAYYLAKEGYEVTVVEKNASSALECSYANGGQLSYSHAEPWANPDFFRQIPGIIFGKNSPWVFNRYFNLHLMKWIIRFLLSCRESRVKENIRYILELALYSRTLIEKLISEENLEFLYSSRGILHIFKDRDILNKALKQSEFQKSLGCDFEFLKNEEECYKKEKSLRFSSKKITGGVFYPFDACGDIYIFSQSLAEISKKMGVKFKYNCTIEDLIVRKDTVRGIKTNNEELQADSFVVSLGAYSPLLLNKHKFRLPICPVKGYSISIPDLDNEASPVLGITDKHNKIVFSRLGDSLRVAGIAEICGYNCNIDKRRIDKLKGLAKELFPRAGDFENASLWSCIRPMTPDGVPLISSYGYKNLYLNTGHGSLGWTLATASAKRVISCMKGGNSREVFIKSM